MAGIRPLFKMDTFDWVWEWGGSKRTGAVIAEIQSDDRLAAEAVIGHTLPICVLIYPAGPESPPILRQLCQNIEQAGKTTHARLQATFRRI